MAELHFEAQTDAASPNEFRSAWTNMKAARRWLIADPEKVPYYVSGWKRHGTLDGPDDCARLATYAEAKAALAMRLGWYLGFALGPDEYSGYWQGGDLDYVVANGLADLANSVPGYVEFSPSGEGAHAIGYGRQFVTLGPNKSGIEAYSSGRYFTVTERMIRDDELACLAGYVEQVFAPRHGAGRAGPSSGDGEDVTVDPKLVTELRSALNFLIADEYDRWIAVGHALKELGNVGRGLWLDWSSSSDKFRPDEDPKIWDTFKPNKTGYQAVFKRAQEQGWVNPASNAARVDTVPDERKPLRFRLLLDDDLDGLAELRWLVKGIIPDSGIGAIYGDSGTYKSFLTLDLLAHVSNGRDWFGRRVKASPAVYVPFEGQGGIPKRIKAWRLAQARLQDPSAVLIAAAPDDVRSNVAVIVEPMNLREAADRDRLVATLIEGGWSGGVLCIDTLAHASNGIDENSSEMGEMIGIFRDLQIRLGGVILLIHHSGKDQSRGMRGWSGLHASMDFVVECQRDKSAGKSEAKFVLTKVKDGSDGVSYGFSMQTVVLGVDEDDEGITSLAVCPAVQVGSSSAEGSRQTKKGINDIDAATAEADDRFIHMWAQEQVTAGNFPSKNSLKGQLPEMKTRYEITQNRILAAADRLVSDGRLTIESKSPNGNPWLKPTDQQHDVGAEGVP